MIPRRQLPAYSPITGSAFIRGIDAALGGRNDHRAVAADLATRFGARHVVLTDSGTSALVLALRTIVGEGRMVALPAYTCVDVAAAAIRSRVRVRLYDVDPETLGPDFDSLGRVLDRGAAAVVVSHLYGLPADIRRAIDLASAHGARVIEDAAQGAGATLCGARLGSFGSLSVISFGRGKGITGGRGGALLARDPDLAPGLEPGGRAVRVPAGWRDLALVTSQWLFGRPSLFSIPASVPGLRLGEMVYRPARDPGRLSAAAAALVRAALDAADGEARVRRRNAGILAAAAADGEGLAQIRTPSEGMPGYIRFPVRDLRHRSPAPSLGIVRAYPRALSDQEELRACLESGEEPLNGSAELARSLFTLPVHSLVTRHDLDRLQEWLRSGSMRRRRDGVGSRARRLVATR